MRVLKDIPYRTADPDPASGRSKLNLHLPDGPTADVLIWVHGGGLTEGDKENPGIDQVICPKGWAVVSPHYRLLQHAPWPACIEDVAAAVAATPSLLKTHGFHPRRVILGGVSAGAYLSAMVALDPSWLAVHGASPAMLSGVIPLSGQMTSHFAYRKQIGHPESKPLIDRAAPLWHVRTDAPPMLLITGDNDLPCRMEENHYMVAALKSVSHRRVSCHVIPGRDHGTVGADLANPGNPVVGLILKFLESPGPVAG